MCLSVRETIYINNDAQFRLMRVKGKRFESRLRGVRCGEEDKGNSPFINKIQPTTQHLIGKPWFKDVFIIFCFVIEKLPRGSY